MKKLPLVLAAIFAFALIIPPGMAGSSEGRYSYIQVESVAIDVIDLNKAMFEVDYQVDENVNFLVLLLGKNDLKQKLCEVFDLDSCRFEVVDMDHARFSSEIHSYNNGDGTYWFPERVFKTEIPNLTIKAQDNYKIFESIKEFPGIGYYYGSRN